MLTTLFDKAKMKAILFLWLSAALTQLLSSLKTASLRSNPETKEIRIVNTFTGCTTHLLNFQNSDINFRIIIQPIVLLQYMLFPYDLYMYPIEMSPIRSKNFWTWMQT